MQAGSSCRVPLLSEPDMSTSLRLLQLKPRAKTEMTWLYAGDVYRRDSIDQSHYPVFHQMEGV